MGVATVRMWCAWGASNQDWLWERPTCGMRERHFRDRRLTERQPDEAGPGRRAGRRGSPVVYAAVRASARGATLVAPSGVAPGPSSA